MAPVESIRVEISPDLLVASLEVLPSPPGSEPLTRADLERAIAEAGVVYGLLPERLDEILAACAGGDLPPSPIPIAEGREARPGRDGSLKLLLPITSADRAPPAGDEPQQVDHRARGGVTSVEQGDLIGLLRPAHPGEPGQGVEGSELGVEPVSDPELRPGAHVDRRERADGKFELVAAMDGILQADDDGLLSVTDQIEIPGDVDYSTGNIEARGSVFVKGSVRSSFRLTSTRDVRVGHSIEDAVVEVQGDLTVDKHILGGDEGHVHVGGALVAGNTQNARVRCKGDVTLQGSDTGSVIECDGRLTAVEGRGRLSGGTYTAVRGLEVCELGSTIGAPTLIRVGTNAVDRAELAGIESERARTAEQATLVRLKLERMRETASQGDVTQTRAHKVRELMKDIRELTGEEAQLERRRQAILEKYAALPVSEVRVHGSVHTGVELELRHLERRIETHREGVRYYYSAENHCIEVEDL